MNNKNYADISVIIPCYNSYKTIERALNSVVNQSLLPREIILVDDCSTDKTLELLIIDPTAYQRSYHQHHPDLE